MARLNGTTKTVTIVMVIMILSRLLGFIREVIMTNTFGRGIETDAFFAAFTIPDLMYTLLVGGALSAAFIPVFTSYLATEGEKEAWKVGSSFINLVVFALVIISILGILFAKYLVPFVAYGFKGEQLALTIKLTRFMFPAVTFTALAGLTSGILQAYKQFYVSYIGPILYNIGIIFGTIFLSQYFGIIGTAIGVIIGAITNFLFQFFFAKNKMQYYYLGFDFKHPGIRKIFKLILPTLIGLSVNQVSLIVNQNIASLLDTGSITALRLANRIIQLPLGIFAVSIASVIFPTITSQIARGEFEKFKYTFSLGMRNILFIIIPSAVGLFVLRMPLIRLLFVNGAFTEHDAFITAQVLLYYTPGLVTQAGIQILIRGFYANHDTKTPLKVSIISVISNILFNIVFVKYTSFGVKGLAFVYSTTSFMNMVILYYIFSKRMDGIKDKEIFISIGKTLLACIGMGLVVASVNMYLTKFINPFDKYLQIFQIGISSITGVGIFVLIAYLLKMEELRRVVKILLRK
ncbi:murein biosynthesis integral membrane protein MurJ [Crassaminicella thermophila]|uniref:Probable lipid II flippase MurJ n=1 Tax=Crassaminicella thermophila TaxID=2599308 RepID=A0A5C0SES5_CRATE|nr:murein biosynthesis integral membrane protein MurJ [Crassaminicella thermophila]QEK13135.1 murein biosynthesis integral membrane protein MurJ [Crassaminicella thermophila]